jgi:uncharacterized protein YjbI with pentapeptide repeats
MHCCAMSDILRHSKFPSALSLAHSWCNRGDTIVSKLRLWWQKTRKPLSVILITLPLLAGLIVLIFAGYWFNWDWTGFNEHIGPKVPQYQPAKTLWDWLQLLGVLAIPAVVGLGTVWFTTKQIQTNEAANKQQHETELQIATDNQREVALQGYIDKMSELLLRENLRGSAEDAEVRKIARVRTLTVLRGLDAVRKGSVIQFLRESGLLIKGTHIIDMSGVNLNKAQLEGAYLSQVDLSETIMSGALLHATFLSDANLIRANLRTADLTGATLYKANLFEADLTGADLRAATLNKASLKSANLSGADLSGANLSEANLKSANLSEANLRHTNLSGADLIGADLSGAILTESNLSGADLRTADLSKAIVTAEQLATVSSLKGATMPDGSIRYL